MPKEKEPRVINISTEDDRPIALIINGIAVTIAPQKEAPKKEESPDDIVDWEPTPSGDRPITRRERDDKDWETYCWVTR